MLMTTDEPLWAFDSWLSFCEYVPGGGTKLSRTTGGRWDDYIMDCFGGVSHRRLSHRTRGR